MSEPPFVYRNPIWRIIRIFLFLAAGLTVVGVPALIGVIHLNKPATREGAVAAGCLVTTALALPGAGAMLLSALLTIPSARKADRCFDSFRRHECLAEWTYSDDEWRRYARSEDKRLQKVGWVMAALVGAPCLVIGLIIAWSATSTLRGRIIGLSSGTAAALALAGIIIGCNRLYMSARRRRLLSCPRAFISRSAIFCGGDFTYWGSNMLVLRSARLIEGDNPQLEFIVGTGGAARNIARAADIATTLAGRPMSTSNMTWRYTVLVPQGRQAEADAVLRTILQPPASKTAAVTVAPAPAASATTAPAAAAPATIASAKAPAIHADAPHFDPDPASIRVEAPESRSLAVRSPSLFGKAKFWWWSTLGLLLVGLGMFLVSGGLAAGSAATALAVIGFLMWCVSPITLVIACILTIKRWRSQSADRLSR